MLLRVIVIFLLVVLVLRALGRLLVWLAGRAAQGRPGARERPAAADRGERRPLSQCPACGTYFETRRGLPARRLARPGTQPPLVCSEACRKAGRTGSKPA